MNKSISDQYKLVIEGKLSQSQFKHNALLRFPQFITNVTSFNDTVKILKNKNIISENKQEEYHDCDPQQYDLGMRYEIEKGTDEDKASKIVYKNLKDNRSYYTDLYLSGYKEESMKKDKKNRTDISTEVKKDNYIDKSNGFKKIKIKTEDIKQDRLTEDELKIIIGNILNESNEILSEPISIDDLTYDKALKIAGKSGFSIQNKSFNSNSVIFNDRNFNQWKKDILDIFKGSDTLVYDKKFNSFKFTDQSYYKKGETSVNNFYNSLKYKGD